MNDVKGFIRCRGTFSSLATRRRYEGPAYQGNVQLKDAATAMRETWKIIVRDKMSCEALPAQRAWLGLGAWRGKGVGATRRGH